MIAVKNLSKTHGGKLLFEDVSFVLNKGDKIGFIGPNGSGKSTLLKCIMGMEEPDQGYIENKNNDIGFVPQTIDYEESEIINSYLLKAISEDWEEYKIDEVLEITKLDHLDKETLVSHLSGGQKTRLGLAKVLLKDPDYIFLDEPTNNLDMKGILWLENFVKDFKGCVFVISHDRSFLDNVATKIFELDPLAHKIESYTGNYSNFVEEKRNRLQKELAEFKRHEKKRQKMELWIALKKQQLAVYDNPKVARQLENMKKRYTREVENSDVKKPSKYKQIRVNELGSFVHKSKVIYKIKDLDSNGLFICPELVISGQDKILLEGKNGTGKTTFIKHLLGLNKHYSGTILEGNDVKIGYFSQEHETLVSKKTVIKEFMDETNKGEYEARQILAKYMFFGDKVFEKVSRLSDGEKVKLIVAELTTQKNDFLILDEPTNHLDIESREVLDQAIAEYEGGYLIISHDRYFLDNLNLNRFLKIEDKILREC